MYFWHADKVRNFLQVDTIILGIRNRHAQISKIRSLYILAVSSKKLWRWGWFFWLQINTKVFYKLIVSLWVCIPRHVHSTQNNKFAISLQYLKENMKDAVYFLLANKRQSFLQIDSYKLISTQKNSTLQILVSFDSIDSTFIAVLW